MGQVTKIQQLYTHQQLGLSLSYSCSGCVTGGMFCSPHEEKYCSALPAKLLEEVDSLEENLD
jgi:hypothetical protein